ncbi:MAG: hypothetical protein UW41_C0038G0006 [Candidatus Collierbacteria bacterium GW2011_GWC2_44_18]|uniref:Uncharacterized protein n=2 Tax=Microgenomates group TaxID=1794810 RepID=A0A0G1LAF5_9BACT|nr:MAG: hypothetical protein UW16_C0028G0006 [Microgenomates group bacterium GW2011_GWC1_44_10]KKT48166.1 MAG: hypothetical protein UW41_C0038G0006 [Candidatus Collierbacteria bacterium GW2011_GWC2_44_18]KKT65617.1 MAG: hypothetical protein UW60_C0040G0006 [Candidatus Woesebacteria bacterium GW2011_GWA2_44_33]
MSESRRTFFTFLSIAGTFLFLILMGITKSAFLVGPTIGLFFSALALSSYALNVDGPGGIGGTVDYHPDPTGSKTKKWLLTIWSSVVAIIIVLKTTGWTVIPQLTIANPSLWIPIFIILIIFGLFGFRR